MPAGLMAGCGKLGSGARRQDMMSTHFPAFPQSSNEMVRLRATRKRRPLPEGEGARRPEPIAWAYSAAGTSTTGQPAASTARRSRPPRRPPPPSASRSSNAPSSVPPRPRHGRGRSRAAPAQSLGAPLAPCSSSPAQ
ncbi:unnamed protein product [Prorocentrum cordatum]|uniref:Uncharacterized protein n=1 Tax=Prorocentrum cordatum TaxID=2364126 RepID=A0ABN9Q2X1_9DINO|nr:unnamed protein product [Polarella glacialis]